MTQCKVSLCKNGAVFSSDACWHHIEDKKAYTEKLAKLAGEKTSFKGVNLSGVDLANFDLVGSDISFANLSRTNLTSSNLVNANLKNTELLGANMTNTDLTGANLEGSDLTRANLKGGRLWHANLENANLIEADLTAADMWSAKLANVRLWRTVLSHAISLSKKNFEFKVGSYYGVYGIDEKGIYSAEEAYRDLKNYFLKHGRYTDASWASFKEKSMERLLLKKNRALTYIPNLIMNILCGYGEKPIRIVISSFFTILSYAFVYFSLDAVRFSQSESYKMSVVDYIYYSTVTFTTVGYGDFIPKHSDLFRFLAGSEAFLGVFLTGLFIFTLARRYSAR